MQGDFFVLGFDNERHPRMVSFLFYASLLMAAAATGARLQRQASVVVGCMAATTAIGSGTHKLCKTALRRFRESPAAELHQPLVDQALDAADQDGDITSISDNA